MNKNHKQLILALILIVFLGCSMFFTTKKKVLVLDTSDVSYQKYHAEFDKAFLEPADFGGFKVVVISERDGQEGPRWFNVYAVNKGTGKIYTVGEGTDTYKINKDSITLGAMYGSGAIIDSVYVYNPQTDRFEVKE